MDSLVSNDVTEIQDGKNNNAQNTDKPSELIIDKQEYQQVFRMFDKNNTGEIHINEVYNMINMFEQSANGQSNKSDNNNMSTEYKFDFKMKQNSLGKGVTSKGSH